jgi:plastocyanin domain-containing protein
VVVDQQHPDHAGSFVGARGKRTCSRTPCGEVPSIAQLTVTAVGVVAIVWVLWYFLFSSTPAVAAAESDGVQEVRVIVKGGYTPDTIVVEAGKPVRLQFYRDEIADCSERLVFEAFDIDVALPAFETTPIEFTPTEAGEFPSAAA